MPVLRARPGHDRAVTPIVAVLLMLAITVVLASVMYVTISQMMPSSPQTPQPLGVIVQKTGTNWTVVIASVSTGTSTQFIYMQIADPNGLPIDQYKPLTNYSGFYDSDPAGTLSAGDRVLLPIANYPDGCLITIKDDQKMLYQGVLRA